MKLNSRHYVFATEYLVDFNATQAAIRAGYSSRTAPSISCQLLKKPEIKQLIAEGKAQRLEQLGLTQADILEDLLHVARADPRELVEYRRGACRYCYGAGFRYQRTPAEMESAVAQHMVSEGGKQGLAFDMQGGVGFNPKLHPHPGCPECYGEGHGYEFVKDTRNLSAAAAKLYAGLKTTKDGIEIKTRSQDKALELVGKHAGLWDKGDGGDGETNEVTIHGGLPE